MSSFVEFQEVYKRYRVGDVEITASNGVTFEIKKGEFAVIVGASGAGKTTVLNLLGGMDTCVKVIFQQTVDISGYNQRQLTSYRRFDIGFVFQFYNLVQNLTAKENVELATQICKDALNVEETLREVGLGERMDNFPSQLSGGERNESRLRALLPKIQSFFYAMSQLVRLIIIQEKRFLNFCKILVVRTI